MNKSAHIKSSVKLVKKAVAETKEPSEKEEDEEKQDKGEQDPRVEEEGIAVMT